MLPIGQIPDAANVKAAAANARTLVRRCSAAVPQLAASSRWCFVLAASSRCCRIVFLAGSPAERQLFRTDFRFAPSPRCASASNIFPMALRRSAPPSNKPHSAEKSTPVWLAIWRIWAGFANSQHRDAAFATPNNICAHSSLLQH